MQTLFSDISITVNLIGAVFTRAGFILLVSSGVGVNNLDAKAFACSSSWMVSIPGSFQLQN